ncbi:MAG: hypothetical protein ACRBCT_00365 [Alphaproteobacteria bacterium]
MPAVNKKQKSKSTIKVSELSEEQQTELRDLAIQMSHSASENANKMLFGLNGAGVGLAALSNGQILVWPFAIGTTCIMFTYLFNYIRSLELIDRLEKDEWPREEGWLFWLIFVTALLSGVSYLVGIWLAVIL